MLVKLSKEERVKLGSMLQQIVEAAVGQRDDLEPRWMASDKIYMGEQMESLKPPWKDAPSYNPPILQSKLDQVQSFTVGAVTRLNPFVLVRAGGPMGNKVSRIETALHYMLQRGDYRVAVQKAANIALRRGKGIIRSYWEKGFYVGDENAPYVKGRVCMDVIDLRNFIAYPATATNLEQTVCHGHAFDSRRWEIAQKIESGEYYKDIDDSKYSSSMDEADRQPYDRLADMRQENAQRQEDYTVATYSLCVRNMWDSAEKDRWYNVVFDYSTGCVFSVEMFQTASTWYSEIAYHQEVDTFYPKTCRAFVLQSSQQQIQDMLNMTTWVSMYNSIPLVFVSGCNLPDDMTKAMPGMVVNLDRGGQIFTLQSRGDLSVFPQLINIGMQFADMAARISQAGQGANLRSDTTATEASIISQGQMVGVGQDTENLSYGLAKLGAYVLQLIGLNFEEFHKDYVVDGVLDDVYNAQDFFGDYYLEVNGQTPINNPVSENQSIQMLLGALGPLLQQQLGQFVQMNPEMGPKLITKLIENSFPGEDIVRKEQQPSGPNGAELPGIGMQPSMGMVPGLPPSGGGGFEELLGQLNDPNAGAGGGLEQIPGGGGQVA